METIPQEKTGNGLRPLTLDSEYEIEKGGGGGSSRLRGKKAVGGEGTPLSSKQAPPQALLQ